MAEIAAGELAVEAMGGGLGEILSWPEDPSALYDAASWGQLWPTSKNSYGANVNAITRFLTLLLLIYAVMTGNWRSSLLGLIVLWVVMFYLDQHQRTLMTACIKTMEELTGTTGGGRGGSTNTSYRSMGGGGPAPVGACHARQKAVGQTCPGVQCDGRDGCWLTGVPSVGGPVPGLPVELQKEGPLTSCKMPTIDNPYMNAIPGDSAVAQATPACPPEQSEASLQAAVSTAFNRNLFANSNDLWQQRQMDRQFTTNPASTYANDRDSFMRWLYDTPFVCKDGDGDACFKQGY